MTQPSAEIGAPPSFALNNPTPLLTDHGVGVQIYGCKRGDDGRLTWTFREPLATLMHDGRTVGRHFAGPVWSFNGGEEIVGEVVATAPGATSRDIPLLKLAVIAHRGDGFLKTAKLVLRLNTQGGVLAGPCTSEGALRLQTYSADYVFLP
jgi:hypothetical protein